MTVYDIVEAIAGALYGIDSNKTIYTEYSEQDFETPCFYIHPLPGSHKPLTGDVYHKRVTFDIQFFPTLNGSEKKQCLDMSDKLLEGLEYIMVNDTALMSKDLDYKIVDDILHVQANYNFNVIKQVTPDDDMTSLTQDSSTKG